MSYVVVPSSLAGLPKLENAAQRRHREHSAQSPSDQQVFALDRLAAPEQHIEVRTPEEGECHGEEVLESRVQSVNASPSETGTELWKTIAPVMLPRARVSLLPLSQRTELLRPQIGRASCRE